MQKLQNDYKGKGLSVVMINIDEEPSMVPIFLKRRPATATVLLNAAKIDKSYGVRGIPATFIIDGKSVVRHYIVGFDEKDGEKKLREKIEALLSEGERAASAAAPKQ